MKKIVIASIGILFLLINACTNKTTHLNKSTIENNLTVSKDTLRHLKYRIPNCDSALLFMKQVFSPVKSEPMLKKLLPIERVVFVRIPGEGLDLQVNERYKFYVNPDCFIGQPAEVAFQTFCQMDSVASFVTLDQGFQAKNLSWTLSVGGFGTYLDLRFARGVVIKAAFSKVSNSH